MRSSRDLARGIFCGCLWIAFAAGSAYAQALEANDDSYGVPFGESLVIEAFGVLDNDVLDGESAGESGATAALVSDASHGTLALAADGSFTYSPGSSFEGNDSFVYEAVFGAVSAVATVTLTACTGGPQIYACWKQAAFLARAAELGLPSFREGFEGDAVWGIVRSPATAVSVHSQGIQWQANDVFRTHDPRA
jgi:VCBS repeat-containing protein